MSVYFMRFGADGPIKIGHALAPYKRRYNFQIASADPIEVLAVVDGGREEEQAIHKLFSHLHIRGELFRPADDLLEYIRSMPRHQKPEPKPRGRPALGIKPTIVRLSEEVREQIRELVGDSGMAQFIREAVERELKRRQRQK